METGLQGFRFEVLLSGHELPRCFQRGSACKEFDAFPNMIDRLATSCGF